jgi:hypothetical protein
MILKFEEWLLDQQERDDLIGDLARVQSMQDVAQTFSKRGADEHKNWADIVTRITEPGHIAVFNEAWQEFLVAKQVAEEALD